MSEKTRSDWENMIPSLRFPSKAIIGGKSMGSASGETFDCISPIDGKVLTQVARCTAQDVERAVKSARKTFESGVWSEMPPVERPA